MLQTHLLPSFVSKETADKITFTGRAVQVLQKHRKLEQTSLQQKGNNTSFYLYKEFLTLEDMLRFTNALKELENSESFPVAQFDYVVEKVRFHVSSLLWKLCVEEGQLLHHLKVTF